MTTINVTSPRPQVLVDEQQLQQLQQEFGRRAIELERLKSAFETLAAVNAPARFVAAAMALCNELASRFKAERVGIGFLKGRYVRLKALSHTEKITRHMQLVQDIEASMEECLDQDVEIIVPPPKDASFVYRATDHLAKTHGPSAVCCLPLRRKNSLMQTQEGHDSDVVAVLSIERAYEKPLTLEEIETLRLTCDLFTARLVDLYEQDKWFGAKAARETRKAFSWAVGPKHTWAKVAAIAVCGLIAFAVLVPGDHKVEGQFVLEASEKQVVPAPFDGYLKTVHATAGDLVLTEQTGARFDDINDTCPLLPVIAFPRPVTVMATLDTAELRNKLNGALADRLAYIKQAQIARKGGIEKEGDAQMAEAEAAKAQSQIDLFNTQIASATIKAPVDGMVLKGDLKTKIGAPLKIGEEMFQVGEREKIRAEVSVPEDQITDVQLEQHGELAATSFPGEHIKFTVERITPVAEVSGAHNVYKVRAIIKPDDQKPWMKPGMEGIAKVYVGRESYGWIWTHRLINWVRMKLWL
jgi:multidrug efflux pump subunit AcrA (membrane-fusion protein)